MIWFYAVGGALALITALQFALAWALFRLGCDKNFIYSSPNARKSHNQNDPWSRYMLMIRQGMARFDTAPSRRVSIQSFDGLTLSARYLPLEGSKRTLILAHGYRSVSGCFDFGCVWEYYRSLGYNLLVIDQRAHGQSQGRYICFGVKERYDIQSWARFVDDTYHPDSIFLDGLSMGSSSVLMASGLELPKSVRGIIADCGFTSPWDEFTYVLAHSFRLPRFPLMQIANMYSRRRAGFDFRECSTLDALKRNRLPVLFVHGANDVFVPTDMSRQNYAACISPKKLVIVEGAGHGVSYLIDTQRCRDELKEFLGKYSA